MQTNRTAQRLVGKICGVQRNHSPQRTPGHGRHQRRQAYHLCGL